MPKGRLCRLLDGEFNCEAESRFFEAGTASPPPQQQQLSLAVQIKGMEYVFRVPRSHTVDESSFLFVVCITCYEYLQQCFKYVFLMPRTKAVLFVLKAGSVQPAAPPCCGQLTWWRMPLASLKLSALIASYLPLLSFVVSDGLVMRAARGILQKGMEEKRWEEERKRSSLSFC